VIIDFHAHLGRTIHGRPALTTEKLLRFQDEHGIDKSVILPLVAPEEEDYYYTTEQALEDCAAHPDRFIPFCNMDPRRGSNDGHYDFCPVLKEYADQGCKGFGEILAEIDSVGMPYLEECLQEFPETIFVGHGPGWWADISADVTNDEKDGYPKGKIRSPGRIDFLLETYPNLHTDLSAGSGYNAMSRDLEFTRTFLEKHYRKILFGTDKFVRDEEPLIIDLLQEIDLPAEMKDAIFWKNAAALLGL